MAEFASKGLATTGVVLGGAAYLINTYGSGIVMEYINKPPFNVVPIVQPDGSLDVDILYNTAKYSLQKAGKTTIAGIIFDETDIEKIMALVKQNAGGTA